MTRSLRRCTDGFKASRDPGVEFIPENGGPE
jgi:hypothetical protein